MEQPLEEFFCESGLNWTGKRLQFFILTSHLCPSSEEMTKGSAFYNHREKVGLQHMLGRAAQQK